MGGKVHYSTHYSEKKICMHEYKYKCRFTVTVSRFQNCQKKPDCEPGILGGKPWKCQLWFELTKRNLEDGEAPGPLN